jgi:L-fuconolactonase
MPVIDAHQHFWQYDPVRHDWISEDMVVIRKDFLPEQLKQIYDKEGVDGCIAVQADQTETETDFLMQLAAENNFIKGVVGWVDLLAENCAERLAHYQQFPIVKGFRHILQAEDPSFMSAPAFVRGISLLSQFDFTYDILVYPRHLSAVQALVAKFPDQRFVIDHIAKPDIKNGLIDEWAAGMRKLAVYPNVYCKISGMVTEADWQHWQADNLYPFLSVITEAFGVHRLMYGSDWPVCLVAATYQEMWQPVKDFYRSFTKEEQAALFGDNARDFYHLSN